MAIEIEGVRIDNWCEEVLRSFEPAKKKQAYRKIGAILRKRNQERMTRQQTPDAKKWPKRAVKKRNNGITNKKKMMANMRKVRNFKAKSTPNEVVIGWFGVVGKTAQIHHEGLIDHGVKMPERPLLGANKEDIRLVYDIVIGMLPD